MRKTPTIASCRRPDASRTCARRRVPACATMEGSRRRVRCPSIYDPLVAKLIAWGSDRDQAIARLARALREYEIEGIKTTIPFFRWLLTNEDYLAARVDTTWLDRVLAVRAGQPFWASDEPVADLASIAAAIQACAVKRRAAPRRRSRSATLGQAGSRRPGARRSDEAARVRAGRRRAGPQRAGRAATAADSRSCSMAHATSSTPSRSSPGGGRC